MTARTKRHRWTYTDAGRILCDDCDLERRRPHSALRRGRLSVSDWDYKIDGEWQRLHRVPPCPLPK